jgi:dTDP-4-amino-4,6-dideoxygalactose transaminase
MSTHNYIAYHKPSIGAEEIQEVVATMQSGWLTTGARTMQFEKEFRDYVHAPHALGVNSCTAGLHLALAALNLRKGDEVITTPLTFCATVNVILHVGATPVLADILPDGNIDPASVAERITPRTRAIIPVHFAGLPVDMDAIWTLARRHRLHVIEDCAHAIGSVYRGWPIGAGNPETGSQSDACAYSFYATKNLTTGEGGMVTTHDENLAERMKVLCLHGISKDAWKRYSAQGKWKYEVLESGFKYNLGDIQSAMGIHQLKKLPSFLETRRRYAAIYNEMLGTVSELETPIDKADCQHAWHLYVIKLNLDTLTVNRDEFITLLQERGVGTSVHFIPIPLHPFFAPYAHLTQNQCPVTMEMYPRILSLPLYPAMTEEEVRHVANEVKDLIATVAKTKTFAAAGGR